MEKSYLVLQEILFLNPLSAEMLYMMQIAPNEGFGPNLYWFLLQKYTTLKLALSTPVRGHI
jgi:hypothetical protein